MKMKRVLSILLIFCLFTGVVPLLGTEAYALEEPRLKSSDACLLIDMDTGQIMYEKEKDMQHSIASLTKIMTVLLAVEAVEKGQCSLNDKVTASAHFRDGLDVSSSNAEIIQGETLTYQDLMYCALVHSANEACNMLAEFIAGDIQSFVKMMNARAREIGCNSTQFVDCNGMNNRSEGHYSTPWELYMITKEALSHPLFYEICSTVDYTVTSSDCRAPFEIHNTNALVSPDGLYGSGYLFEGTVGVKTGFTKPAGYCLVSTCVRDGKRLMAVVLGCNGPLTYTEVPGEYQNFIDSATLYDWGFNNFTFRTIFLAGEVLERRNVSLASDDVTVSLCPDENIQLLIANDVNDNQISYRINVDDGSLKAPISKGDVLGTADVIISGQHFATVNIVAGEDVEARRSDVIKSNIGSFFKSKGFKSAVWIALAILIVIIMLSSYLKYQRKKKLRAKMDAARRKKAQQARAARAAEEQQAQYRRRFEETEADEEPPARQTIDLDALLNELGIEYDENYRK